jgi:hypothetical protein
VFVPDKYTLLSLMHKADTNVLLLSMIEINALAYNSSVNDEDIFFNAKQRQEGRMFRNFLGPRSRMFVIS